MKQLTVAALAFVLFTAVGLAQTTASPEALLKAAQQREQIDGDRAGALVMYEALASKHPTHPAAADALLRMAGIYEDQGNTTRAKAALTRVVTEFARLADRSNEANSRLAALDTGVIDRRVDWPTTARMAGDVNFSPNGQFIAYVDQGTGEIAVRDLKTGAARQLTGIVKAGGYVEFPVVSRDGRFVAFVAYENGKTRRGLRILPINASATTQPRLLVEGEWVTPRGWMPGDREVFALIQGKGIALISVSDGAIRPLQQPERAGFNSTWAVSPDGAFVATHGRAGADSAQHDLFLIPTDGGPFRSLLPGPGSDSVAGWSPDGRHLVFRSNREGSKGGGLWAVPVANGRETGAPILLKAAFLGGPIGLSATGALLYEALVGGRAETTLLVATVDPATGTVVEAARPAAHDANSEHLSPRWSADGKWFLYTTSRPHGPVISIRSNTGVVREVPRKLTYVFSFDVAPDGKAIAFRGNAAPGEGIYVLNTETGELTTVVLKQGKEAQPDGIGYYQPTFSSDGGTLRYYRVVFENGSRRQQQELARNLKTGEERVTRDSPPDASGLQFGSSTDARPLVFLSGQPVTTISVQDNEQSPRRVVFRATRPDALDGNHDIQWMPDGRAVMAKVAGDAPNERHLWWIPLDGRQPKRIELGRSDLVDTGFAVHPDGRQIAYVAGDPIISKNSSLNTEFRLLENFLPGANQGRR